MDRITQPIINSVLHGTLENDRCVDEQSFVLLLEIQKTLSVFEPIECRWRIESVVFKS